MCGILGYVCFNHTKPDKNKLAEMFSQLETRGRDASGFAFINKDKNNSINLIVHKAAVKSSEMIKTDEWKNLDTSGNHDTSYQNENTRNRKK